jgi:hypothetical protein
MPLVCYKGRLFDNTAYLCELLVAYDTKCFIALRDLPVSVGTAFKIVVDYDGTFSVVAPKVWNTPSVHNISADTAGSFKHRLQCELFTGAYCDTAQRHERL